MFERRPIWGIIVGLNVCVLIWLISVQEPVMYDASTAIITSGLQQQQQQQVGNTAEAVVFSLTSRGGREDRDVREKPSQYLGNRTSISSFTTLYSSNNSTKILKHATISESYSQTVAVRTTTDAINLLGENSNSLTSSLGTGLLDVKVRPTPSWKKLTAVSSALPNEDFNRLIDLQHFHYLVPQPVCNSEIQCLILVHSAPQNHEKRQIIRETWASIGRHSLNTPLRVLFLLGAVEDKQLQNKLLNENNRFADIIQGSFMDDYRNMTYKHVMAFKWFLYNCPQAQILIKVDDDVYVNTPQLLKYLGEEQKRSSNRKISPPSKPPLQLQEKYKQLKPEKKEKQDLMNDEKPTTTTTTTPTTTTTINEENSNFIVSPTKDSKSTTSRFLNFNFIFDSLNMFTNSVTVNDSKESITSQSPQFNATKNLFHNPQNLLFCQEIIGSMVKRSYRSKWRVGFKEYAGRYYPPYCPGYAIIYSPDVIFRLYTAAQASKYFWIDDVHITGVLAQQTNTTITTSSHYVLYSNECDRLLTGKTDLKDVEFLFAWHSITSWQIRALWHLQMMATNNDNDNGNSAAAANNHRQETNNSSSPSSSSSLSTSSSTSTSSDKLSYNNISNYLAGEAPLR